jgi:hypothetical protein
VGLFLKKDAKALTIGNPDLELTRHLLTRRSFKSIPAVLNWEAIPANPSVSHLEAQHVHFLFGTSSPTAADSCAPSGSKPLEGVCLEKIVMALKQKNIKS